MRSSQSLTVTGSSCVFDARIGMLPAKSDIFREEVCQVYDLMVASGIGPNEAIRKTRSTLKAINYPFATYDYVMAKLRASGRLRKNRAAANREGE